jgi:hypothetical protein
MLSPTADRRVIFGGRAVLLNTDPRAHTAVLIEPEALKIDPIPLTTTTISHAGASQSLTRLRDSPNSLRTAKFAARIVIDLCAIMFQVGGIEALSVQIDVGDLSRGAAG